MLRSLVGSEMCIRDSLRNGLTDFREIWYGDAYWVSEWDRKLKFPIFENPRRRTAAILRNGKIAISQPRFERFRQNLARRRSSTLLSVPTVKNLKFPKSKMVAAAILKIENRLYLRNGLTDLRKIWHDDAYWPSQANRKLKFRTFENSRWRTAAILNMENRP